MLPHRRLVCGIGRQGGEGESCCSRVRARRGTREIPSGQCWAQHSSFLHSVLLSSIPALVAFRSSSRHFRHIQKRRILQNGHSFKEMDLVTDRRSLSVTSLRITRRTRSVCKRRIRREEKRRGEKRREEKGREGKRREEKGREEKRREERMKKRERANENERMKEKEREKEGVKEGHTATRERQLKVSDIYHTFSI